MKTAVKSADLRVKRCRIEWDKSCEFKKSATQATRRGGAYLLFRVPRHPLLDVRYDLVEPVLRGAAAQWDGALLQAIKLIQHTVHLGRGASRRGGRGKRVFKREGPDSQGHSVAPEASHE